VTAALWSALDGLAGAATMLCRWLLYWAACLIVVGILVGATLSASVMATPWMREGISRWWRERLKPSEPKPDARATTRLPGVQQYSRDHWPPGGTAS